MSDELRLSRVTNAIARVADPTTDGHRFRDAPVLLTGEAAVLLAPNGHDILLFALRLLVRISRRVDVLVPRECATLALEAASLVGEIGLGGTVRTDDNPEYAGYAAILSIGTTARTDLPWTVINSNGWLARVSSGGTSIGASCERTNPIGARAAACLGVAEVFKRIATVKPERGALLDGVSFSSFDYLCGHSDPGPEVPVGLVLPTFLVGGCGAIGNGITELLAALRAKGAGASVDRQDFGEENLGTCALMRVVDIGKAKAELMSAVLRTSGLDVTGIKATIAEIAPRLGADLPYPRIVLGGLDRIEPRYELQRLWPDVYIDGATSDFGCQVTRHPWGEDVGCALCVFALPLVSADAVALRLTGLRPGRLHDPEARIELSDVDAAATPEQRAWLSAHTGEKVCAVVPAALLAEISTAEHPDHFDPSVPFVACLAAAFVVGELVKVALGSGSSLAPRFQMDVLQGPQRGAFFEEGRTDTCECAMRAKNIERARADRRGDGPVSRTGGR